MVAVEKVPDNITYPGQRSSAVPMPVAALARACGKMYSHRFEGKEAFGNALNE